MVEARPSDAPNRRFLTLRNALLIVLVVVSQTLILVSLSSSVFVQEHDLDIASLILPSNYSMVVSQRVPHQTEASTVQSQTTSLIISPDGVLDSATCDQLLQHFHQISQRFHDGDPTVAPPLINYGFYAGQGFGRLVDHSMSHCLLSFTLDRPCLIDLSDRDPFYTWRAFLHTGSYDWEFESNAHTAADRAQLAVLAARVRQAVVQLPNQGAGEWADPVPHVPDLHLMGKLNWPKGKTDRQKYFGYILPWRADHIPKALLSPNWGSAWFPHLQTPVYFGQCHRQQLMTLMQNAMYEPTPLSMKLHTLRRYQVMRNPLRPYGAIHIRFVILQIEKIFQGEDKELVTALESCLHYAQTKTNVTEWWLISDKPSRAIDLVQQIAADQTDLRLYYAPEHANATEFAEHSNNARARGMFGHDSMSVSILDWMVLHESRAAIVTKGSYGDTGARGRGKVLHVHETLGHNPCGVFSLYF